VKLDKELSKKEIELENESFFENQNLGYSDVNFHNQLKSLKNKEPNKITVVDSAEERSASLVIGSMKNIEPKIVTEGSVFEMEQSQRDLEDEKNQQSPKRKKKRPKNLSLGKKNWQGRQNYMQDNPGRKGSSEEMDIIRCRTDKLPQLRQSLS